MPTKSLKKIKKNWEKTKTGAKMTKTAPKLVPKLVTPLDQQAPPPNFKSVKLEDFITELGGFFAQIQLFTDIINKYNQLMNASSKELDVIITSKAELSSDELGSIKTNLSSKLNKQLNIKNNIDDSIIGGIKMRIGNIIIDNSLSNKLMKLKNNLKNNHANME